jgi:hypothetical protein
VGVHFQNSGVQQFPATLSSHQQTNNSLTMVTTQNSGGSLGEPALPSCLSSGSGAGVTSGGSGGCLSSTGNPTQNHNPSVSSLSLHPQISAISHGGLGPPSCLSSGSSSSVTSSGSGGCVSSTGNPLQTHNPNGNQVSHIPTNTT